MNTTKNTSTLEGKRYVACIRVSRINGRSGQSFMSPEQQADGINGFARMHGIEVAEWVDENDGGTQDVSAGSTERVGLQHAVEQCRTGKADGIIVAKIDRFARTVQGGLSVIGELEDMGRDLVAVQEGVIVGDEKATATDTLKRNLYLMLAQWQRDTLAESWNATRERHIANGVHTVEPYGYRKDAQRKLTKVESEAPFVLMAFELRAAGEGWQRIADKLNASGATPRTAQGFTHARISKMVANRTYLGEVRSGEYVNTEAHEAIVTLDLFERANAAKGINRQGNAATYALTGLVRSASCGGRMRGNTKRTPAGAIRYYSCRKVHSFGRCPRPAGANADQLEALVRAAFRSEYLSEDGAACTGSEAGDVIDLAQAQLDAAKAEVRDFLGSTAAAALKSVSPELWEEGLAERTQAVSEAQSDLTAARNAAHGFALPADLAVTLDALPLDVLRGYLCDGFELVAVAPQPIGRKRSPMVERVAIFTGNETGMPELVGGGLNPIEVAAA